MKLKAFFEYFTRAEYDLRGKYSAVDVAKYIANKCSVERHFISNLQLQKIMYYVQKHFLQNQKRALFSEEIEAWAFGPVVRKVYDYFCGFGAMPIFFLLSSESPIAKEDSKVIDRIVESKRELNPWAMVEDTHQKGKAWDMIYQDGLGYKDVIPKRLIAKNG